MYCRKNYRDLLLTFVPTYLYLHVNVLTRDISDLNCNKLIKLLKIIYFNKTSISFMKSDVVVGNNYLFNYAHNILLN